MGRPNPARLERQQLCDLLTDLGPDAPTLCDGWRTRGLAAHLLLRERRPLAAPGIVVAPLAGYTERVQRTLAARPYADLVRQLRVPPWWMRPALLDRTVNVLEMFIHHEDVRRAQPQWRPRSLPDVDPQLFQRAAGLAKLRLRRFPADVRVEAPGHGTVRTGRGGEKVLVSGPPGELTMFFSGRQQVAQVSLQGPPELTGRLAAARIGL